MPLRNATTTLLAAGAFATIGFDLFGQSLSPMIQGLLGVDGSFIGAKLAPAPLAAQSLGVLTGLSGQVIGSLGLGHAVHALTGVVLYPLGYALLARPIANAVSTRVLGRAAPWWVTGAAFGAVLWAFALYVMAHLVAGNPPFLGWGGLTWVALWGHVLYGLVVAGVVARRERVVVAKRNYEPREGFEPPLASVA